MSSRDRGPDEARPLPQQRGRDDDLGAETRRRPGDDGFVVDTRRRGRPSPSPRRSAPQRAARRGPAGTLYPEDEGYGAPRGAAGSDPDERHVEPGRRDPYRGDPGPSRAGRPPSAAGDPARRPSPSRSGKARPVGDDGLATGPRTPSRRRRRRARAVILLVLLVVLAWVAFMVWVPFAAWNKVTRADNVPAGDRPADTAGYNYLLVGSDGRGGLTPEQAKALNAGGAVEGQRTDSIILVHVPQGGGKSALISLPRDSYVPIPGHRTNKINAAYAFGGPRLLEQTVEQVTGVHIDGYVEIGFGGFAGVVDSLGGVDVCVPFDMADKDAAIDLKKGCQTLDGATALGYVRARKSDPRGDIGRAERQRQFLGAIMKKAVTPSTVLLPWRYKAFADSASSGLVVGQDTQLTDAVRVLQALRGVDGGDTLSLVVPVADPGYQTPNAGLAVKWDTAQALALFTAIKNDDPLSLPPAGTTGK